MSVTKPDGSNLKILDKVNFTLYKDEVVALLGKSGSGKSTFLRVIAGLIAPTRGKVKFIDEQKMLMKYSTRTAMIFQNFGLFPWLTVLENVELGLEALNCPEKERRKRALEAIDLIGLDGFESAYPRELSGGMKQRVGFARALVVNPKIILMDEPFSALDVLTAGTLKTDFLEIWADSGKQLESVVLVTHNIEEAVIMADRVMVLSSNPGTIVSEIKIPLPRPRNIESSEFKKLVNRIYSEMTVATSKVINISEHRIRESEIGQKIPFVSPNHLVAIAVILNSPNYKGRANLAELVKNSQMMAEEILHITEALSMLKFAVAERGEIRLNKSGKTFATAGLDEQKKIFAEHLLLHIPIVAYIRQVLHERPDRKAPMMRFLSHLEDRLSTEDAKNSLKVATVWGRYAELFSYDDAKHVFSLDDSMP